MAPADWSLDRPLVAACAGVSAAIRTKAKGHNAMRDLRKEASSTSVVA
jgi:hypothetical protein